MKIIDLEKPNIRIVKNFLTDEQCDDLLYVKNFSENLWNLDFDINYPKEEEVSSDLWPSIKQWQGMCINITDDKFYVRYGLDKEYFDELEKVVKLHTEERFNVKVDHEQYLINRWRVGRQQSPHLDYFIEDDGFHDYEMLEMNNLPRSYLKTFGGRFQTKHFSSLIYLNDDYVGGELYFPQYENYSIKPEKGTLVTFRGDENTLHGVKMVEEGIRYTVSIFWTDQSKLDKVV